MVSLLALLASVVPLHFGHLALWEKIAVIALAIVPFVALGVVMVVVQRRDAAAEDADEKPRRAQS